MMTKAELIELGEDIKKNGLEQPIAVIMEGVEVVASADGSYDITAPTRTIVLDGRNRLDAMEAVGLKVVDEKGELLDSVAHSVIDPEVIDPYSYVISNNYRRRHLTVEQRHEIMAEYLRRDPNKSDRQIGRELGHDHKTIAKVRAEQEGVGSIPHSATRTASDGRQQPAHKPAPRSAVNTCTSGQAVTSAEVRKAQYAAEEEQLDRVCAATDLIEPLAPPPPNAQHDLDLAAETRSANVAPRRQADRPHKAASTSIGQKHTTGLDIVNVWNTTPPPERIRALNNIGLKPLLEALPPDWLSAIEMWVTEQRKSVAARPVSIEDVNGFPNMPEHLKRLN
jgi:hypothetical protein